MSGGSASFRRSGKERWHCPPPAPETRYRLVVAEYEEYLVDDAMPYDRIPTEKDRRMVFVEHVELT